MEELWATGQCDLKGKYYTMNDCRLGPLPSRQIPLICAGTSDAGMKFAAEYTAPTTSAAATARSTTRATGADIGSAAARLYGAVGHRHQGACRSP